MITEHQFYAVMSELQGGREALQTIATAVEKIMAANPEPNRPLNLRDLTGDERKVIEALRDGQLQLLPRHTIGEAKPSYIITGEIEPG